MIPNYLFMKKATRAQKETVGPGLAPGSPHPIPLLSLLCYGQPAKFKGYITAAHDEYRI